MAVRAGFKWAGVLAAALGLGIGMPRLLAWRGSQEQEEQSIGNMRHVFMALMSYSQDWDDRLPPIAARSDAGLWSTWPDRLAGYDIARSSFIDPSNPVPLSGSLCTNPVDHYVVRTSFALNGRFWNTFGAGPFPIGNLELPDQTVMLVDAGPIRRDPRGDTPPESDRSRLAFLDYGDTTERYGTMFRYPSSHHGLMTVIGVDGHAVTRRVAHYFPSDGAHDPLYGLVVPGLFNWNGGHPNGQTDRPRHE
jgi:hypothetical protein